MADNPDICVWFEVSSCFIPEEELFFPDGQIAKDGSDEVITKEDQLDNVKFLIVEDSYFFRIHSFFRSNCFVFPFYTRGWQNFPYRVFLEINSNIKMGIINPNLADLSGQLDLLSSQENKPTLVKNYAITPMFTGSLCLIEGVIYRADFYMEDPCIFFTFSPL